MLVLFFIFKRYCHDSSITFEVDEEDTDILLVTCMIADVIAWRKFRRIVKKQDLVRKTEKQVSRKFSSPL